MSVSTRVIIVITILFTIISLGCKKDPTRMTDSEIQELKNRDYDVENMVLRNFKKSELEWRLKSRKVKAFTNPEISYASEVNVLYFSEDNTTTLTARNGTLDYMSGNMTVSQDVVVETDNQKILTHDLMWHDELEKFITDSYVTVIHKDRNTVIEGKGLIANADLTDIKIKKMIRTTIRDVKVIDKKEKGK